MGHIDLVVFGFPCQDLSVAGGRKGFQGERSSLFYDAIRVIEYAKRHCGTRFALLENVPGAFSSNKGGDFAAVVAHMAGLSDVTVPENGWGKEGAALGDCGMLEWGVLKNNEPSPTLSAKMGTGGNNMPMIAYGCTPTTLDPNKVNAITASYGLGGADLETKPLVMQLMDESYSFDSANMGLSLNKEVAATLRAHNSKQPQNVLRANYIVRRLTPIECEKLQGFPPNFTKIPYRNKSADDCPNGVRYKALGNSMAVNVMAWIGQKIQSAVDYKQQ